MMSMRYKRRQQLEDEARLRLRAGTENSGEGIRCNSPLSMNPWSKPMVRLENKKEMNKECLSKDSDITKSTKPEDSAQPSASSQMVKTKPTTLKQKSAEKSAVATPSTAANKALKKDQAPNQVPAKTESTKKNEVVQGKKGNESAKPTTSKQEPQPNNHKKPPLPRQSSSQDDQSL